MRGKTVAIGHATGVLAAKLAVVVVAHVQLQRVRTGVVAIPQSQRVLRAGAVDGGAEAVQRRVDQRVLTALERRSEPLCAHAVLVLPEVTAQLCFGAVR